MCPRNTSAFLDVRRLSSIGDASLPSGHSRWLVPGRHLGLGPAPQPGLVCQNGTPVTRLWGAFPPPYPLHLPTLRWEGRWRGHGGDTLSLSVPSWHSSGCPGHLIAGEPGKQVRLLTAPARSRAGPGRLSGRGRWPPRIGGKGCVRRPGCAGAASRACRHPAPAPSAGR